MRAEPLQLPLALLQRLGAEAPGLHLLLELLCARRVVALGSELALDLLHLLGEEPVLLRLLHPALHPGGDLLLQARELGLGGQEGHEPLEARHGVLEREELKLVLGRQRQAAGHEVGQALGIVRGLDGGEHLGRRLAGDLLVLGESPPHRAGERGELRGRLARRLQRPDLHPEGVGGVGEAHDRRALLPLDEQAQLAVGQLGELQDARHGAHGVEVRFARLLDAALLLGDEEDQAPLGHGRLDAAHRAARGRRRTAPPCAGTPRGPSAGP